MVRPMICREYPMTYNVRDSLAEIAAAEDIVKAFADEKQCRQLMESMVGPRGRI